MHKFLAGLVAGLATLLAAPGALAAPVTVDLRIEGPTRTLFEGPVTTDVRTFRFTGEAAEHRCDGSSGGHATPVPTRGAALVTASEQTPFSIGGTWHDQFGATINEVAGESTAYDPATNRYLVEYENEAAASIGACGDDIRPGDRVLFAYGTGSEPLLRLSGPASARPGETAAVTVRDASGAAVSGASVGGRTTGADGVAVVGPFGSRGDHDLKATKPGTIRSNRLRVCVSDGADGACGSPAGGGSGAPGAGPGGATVRDTAAPATAVALRDGAVFSRRRAPRLLRGTVSDASSLHSVKLRLTRRVGRRCSYFSGRRERFVRMRCGRGSFFRIGNDASWSYLLPRRLGRGRYVLEAKAIDSAFNRGAAERVRFRVR